MKPSPSFGIATRLTSEGAPGPGPTRILRHPDEEAVTPVVGTILVLAITVLGIGAILVWGAPAIQRIQEQNAQLAMQGEFEDLRASAQELSVPDHSRFPTVVLNDGSLAMQAGSRIMVTANHLPGDADCDFRVTAWSDTDDQVTVAAPDCSGSADTVLIAEVVGSNTVPEYNGALGAGIASATFSEGDWVFYLTDGGTPATIYAQAWLFSTDRLAWSLDSTNSRSVYLDAGAVFTETEGTVFLDKEPAIGDSSFGPDYVGIWLRTLTATDYNSLTGPGSFQVYLALTGNNLRVDEPATYSVRYDFQGELAEAWCNSMLLRNGDLPDRYPDQDGDGEIDPGDGDGSNDAIYAVMSGASCSTTTEAGGIRSVKFTRDDNDGDTIRDDPFEFRYLQAEIHAALIP